MPFRINHLLPSMTKLAPWWSSLRHTGFRATAGLAAGWAQKRLQGVRDETPWSANHVPDTARRPLVDVLEQLAGRFDTVVSRDGLLAALPRIGADLDPRAAPIALARFGLQGSWRSATLKELEAGDFPVCLELNNGGFALLLGFDPSSGFSVESEDGETVRVAAHGLALACTGRVLTLGSADPVNGAVDADDRREIMKGPRRWILMRFLSDRRILSQLLIAGLLLNLCSLAMPLFQRAIYDRVIPNLAIESMWTLCIGIMIALGFEFALKQVRADFIEAQGLRVSQQVQTRVMAAITGAKCDRSPKNTGAVLVALRDIESMALIAPAAIVTFFIDVPFFFVFLFLVWMIAGPVALPVLGGALLILVIGAGSMKAVASASGRGVQLMRTRSNLVVDIIDGLSTIKANQAEGKFNRQWSLLSDHIGMNGHETRRWTDAASAATAWTVQGVTVASIAIGVLLVQAGDLTIGALIASSLLASRAMGPISAAIGIISRAHQSLSQFKTVAELLSLEPERHDPQSAVTVEPRAGAYDLRAVSFTYPDSVEPALNQISLTIRRGERIGLIGRSGSGKSTLLELLSGLIEPSQGRVLVDGHNMTHFRVDALRSRIAYAAQDATLFDTTLRENLMLGLSQIDAQALELAVRLTGVDVIAQALPDGFSTKLGQRGGRLSGGQRQAVVLARTLARPSDALLLDEPTAAMDAATEQRLIQALEPLSRDGRTFIVASHRMDVLRLVDRVIWLDAGRIVADKPRDEVLALFRSKAQSA